MILCRRRPFILGLTAAALTLGISGVLFLDVELPAELQGFKLATLRKLRPILPSPSPESEVYVRPGSDGGGGDGSGGDVKGHTNGSDPTVETDPYEEEDDGPPDFAYALKDGDGDGSWSSVTLDEKLETTIPNGAIIHGFSVLDNLVMHNGTFYIVTSNRSAFPEKKEDMVWRPATVGTVERDPSEEDIQFINPDELSAVLGATAILVPGFTWIMYDIPQFMTHYYHWWGEIILGGWRVYSRVGLDKNGGFHPEKLRMPDRFLLPIVSDGQWRDKAQIVGPLMRAAFPRAAMEQRDQWLDLMRLNSTFVFGRVLITNRRAAHRHRWGGCWGKMIGGTQELAVADDFWSPIRKALTKNLLGYIPTLSSLSKSYGVVLEPPGAASKMPVVTYISRQKTGRRLTEESHEGLVEALRELEKQGVCEVQIAVLEDMGLREQIRLAARSTIMVGVHGNGLTHQLWMPPSERSTVIEIVYPNSYDFDYEMLARNMGHKHYIVWNDTLVTYPKGTYHKKLEILDGFHSSRIYVHGPAVAQMIKERLSGVGN